MSSKFSFSGIVVCLDHFSYGNDEIKIASVNTNRYLPDGVFRFYHLYLEQEV